MGTNETERHTMRRRASTSTVEKRRCEQQVEFS